MSRSVSRFRSSGEGHAGRVARAYRSGSIDGRRASLFSAPRAGRRVLARSVLGLRRRSQHVQSRCTQRRAACGSDARASPARPGSSFQPLWIARKASAQPNPKSGARGCEPRSPPVHTRRRDVGQEDRLSSISLGRPPWPERDESDLQMASRKVLFLARTRAVTRSAARPLSHGPENVRRRKQLLQAATVSGPGEGSLGALRAHRRYCEGGQQRSGEPPSTSVGISSALTTSRGGQKAKLCCLTTFRGRSAAYSTSGLATAGFWPCFSVTVRGCGPSGWTSPMSCSERRASGSRGMSGSSSWSTT